MTTDTTNPAVDAFTGAKARHTAQILELNDIGASIMRCEKERQSAIESGKEAENSWRIRFRNLRGAITPEMRAEHSQRIASRELAEEFTTLIKELELDKQAAMIGAVRTGHSYVSAHRVAFTDYVESQWNAAMRNISPRLLRAIKLKIMALELNAGDPRTSSLDEEPVVTVTRMTGEILTSTARAAQLDMEGEPVLTQLGLRRPVLTGVDMRLFNSPASVQKLARELEEKRNKKEKRA